MDKPYKDIPKIDMVRAEIRVLEGRNAYHSKEIQKNNARITFLEEWVDKP